MAPKRKVTLTLGLSKKKHKAATASPVAETAEVATPVQDSTENSTAQYGSLTEFYTAVINGATNLKDPETGEVVSGPFLKLPPKKLYADYYQVIQNPISINEIRQATIVKRKGKESADGNAVPLEEFKQMWLQLTENASTYNDPNSLIVNDAKSLSNYAVSQIDQYGAYLKSIEEKKSSKKIKKEKLESEAAAATEKAAKESEPLPKRKKSTSRSRDSSKRGAKGSAKEEEKSESVVEEEGTPKQAEDAEATSGADNEVLAPKEEPVDIPKQDDANVVINTDDFDDSNEDYTADILKVFRHLLTFKVSHHKNSIPLSKVLLELPDRDDPATEDYYDIITKPMCFNMIGEQLEQGKYANGSSGYKKFISDVNLIFDNALDVFGDGPYYKAATGLSKAFVKRLEKFESQVAERKRQAILNANSGTDERDKLKKKGKDEDAKEFTENGSPQEESVNPNEINVEEEVVKQPVPEAPTIIRKHDVEKAEKIEEIDDITAFIRKFTICSTTNLNNFANNWKSLVSSNTPATFNNKQNANNNPSAQGPAIFENIIVEPAGNTTVGGSTYVMQLPGSAVVGHEISCIVHLQNKIVDEKYVSELRVNGESINGVPMSISYNEEAGDDGIFCASKYSVRLGYGLNHFEFTLKVPFPLKGKASSSSSLEPSENKQEEADNETSSEKNEDSEEKTHEKRERHERGKSQEFVENVKVWLNITR
ncbi:hypothetical protein PMKS-002094 [Pichia membranifaciens]|uniref:Bromo domain-containing protein n=1 Tax=Pichia membranifaciens TaxID=4926 RepID=A0A1Q2YGL0_9ASCO|nr:hypothetical protein PMKS-002094 [Pichia membranifaciens]